ncbi:regulatory protein RecX [Leifsonia sp. AG29]|uniref:regulatory protein RecX n=1 Tax=Leifsonia sp. AG29 TaxID=2598860 RepID=UPI001E646AD4|nr:regulatory protein RecX [Leifsonia sp. AG29]
MVVSFPSDPSGSSGAEDVERLAPVTPLSRAAKVRGDGSGAHPARGSARRAAAEGPAVERPVAELPVGERAGAVVPSSRSRSARSLGADTSDASPGWNNTWAEDRPRNRASDPAEPSGDSPGPFSTSADDDESDRQSRRAAGLTIRQLARRGMSRWELEQLLTRREIAPDVFGPELDRLEAMGVIDDASLATSLAFTQHSRKGLGRTAIEQDLKRRHIDPELIEVALADIGDDDELERASELAIKRIGQLSSYDDETARRRLHGFLARKGYASDVIRQAMEAAFATRRGRGTSGVRFQ